MQNAKKRRKNECLDEGLRLVLSKQDMDPYEVDALMNGYENS